MTQTVGTSAITGYTNLNTLIPSLADAADIAEAFRLYHFGEATGVGTGANNTNPANVKANSIAGTLISLQSTVGSLVTNAGVSYGEFVAKGDLLSTSGVGSAANVQRLAVGTAGQVLTVDSTTTTGLKWSTPYAQPTIGSTAITSGGTITTINGLTLGTSTTLTAPAINAPTVTQLYLSDSVIVFEGPTANGFEITLAAPSEPSSDVQINLPNYSGDIVLYQDMTGYVNSYTSIFAPSNGATLTNVVSISATTIGATNISATNITGSSNLLNLSSPKESWNVTGTGLGVTQRLTCAINSVFYYNADSTTNSLINFGGTSGNTLNANMSVGQAISIVVLTKNGTTAYYPNSFQVDGAANYTIKWLGGVVPSSGNINSVDMYNFTIRKVADTQFEIFASGPVKYA